MNSNAEPLELGVDEMALMCALPETSPQFFIPRLHNKPQNPIMDTLRLTQSRYNAQPTAVKPAPMSPPELHLLSEDVFRYEQEKGSHRLEPIWELAVARRPGHVNQVLSWDALRSSYNANVSPSPFLSEQTSETSASARYHLRPLLHDPYVQLVYVQAPDLFQSLLLTVSGTSSNLHIWDHIQQKFVLRTLRGKASGQVVMVGKDEVVSASLIQRFITIGNLMRRLELLIDGRDPSHSNRRSTPTLHAFTHALSSILAYLRHMAESIPLELHGMPGVDARLTALWTRYEDMEYILQSLATLSGREEHVDPSTYAPLPTTSTSLLSLIYKHLDDHIERSSPRVVTGMLAFMLTNTSRGYMQTLCTSVGYNTPNSQSRPPIIQGRMPSDDVQRLYAELFDDEDHGGANVDEGRDLEAHEFPTFVTSEVAEVFSRARKSLVLLRAADPGHPLLTSKHLHPEIDWLWTEEQVENIEDGVFPEGPQALNRIHRRTEETASLTSVADVMRGFKVFDSLPGDPGHIAHPAASSRTSLLSGANPTFTLRAFLTAFPAALPPSTPTLAHLTARVLSPLITHAQALSGALVARFLSPNTHLHLHTHLVLLRGYILLTAHAFKARLQDALFDDSEDVSAPVVGSRTYAASEAREHARERTRTKSGPSRSRSRAASEAGHEGNEDKSKEKKKQGRRAIGLSPALIIGDKWPPLGSDLNFFLRTVVVDALEQSRFVQQERDEDTTEYETRTAQKRIVDEAEWRLGFAIRDLPTGTGREKWLNPLSIEALDFLYMHYQPPHPLDVLITPAILSKYHRMFAFNLRLLRVENVVRTLFRLTRKATAPLFPTLSSSNKLLLHFRFVAHTFIMALSSYVYDIAIGSNMDAFLARLAAASASASASTSSDHRQFAREEPVAFADVFSLAEHHSRVLDDVLSSCLLRSGQKAAGDILRGCMELVLELGVLAGEVKDGGLEEYEAAPMLEELWGKFRTKMTTFVKVLKALVEKEADASGLVLSDIPLHIMHGHERVSGTTANLHQLLLRLNMSDWWTRKKNPRPM